MMLVISQSSFLCPRIKCSVEKPKIPLFGNNNNNNNNSDEKKYCLRRNNVLHNGYSYFTSPYHPLQSELPKHLEIDHEEDIAGIGILKFFHGKNVFITGATGLLGKVLVEKILRSTDIGKIYLLIKAKDKDAAFDRLTKEIINSELLSCLKEKHGNYYETFVREKLIPIVGNICEPNLGMDSNSAHAIKKDIHVIIQSAASTTLNDRYDLLLDANMNAPQRLMRFAKTCNNLKLFVHMSTAYVNGRREGIIMEKPLIMGQNRRKDDDDDEMTSSFPRLDVMDELNMALKSCNDSSLDDCDFTKILKRLGHDRATFYGWYNPYHLTKAMGEMVLNEIRGDVPLLIIRPSVIEGSYKDPFPGWIQGNRMYDPVIISYGKGQLPAFICDPNKHMDIIPVDMVANTTIAAVAKHGAINKPQLNVYHVASSAVNPLTFSDFFDFLYNYFKSAPLIQSENNIPKIKCFDNFNDFSKHTREEISHRNGITYKVGADDDKMIRKIQSRCKAKVAYAEQLCKMYEFAGLFNARFHNGNTQKLMEEMSKEEQLNFDVDVMNINWRKYFQEIHIPGLRKHLLNGSRTSI